MAEISTATLSDALKIFYIAPIRDQMDYEANPFLAQLEKNAEEVMGGQIRMAMKYGRHGGIGNRAEYGNLPTPGSRKVRQVEYPTKNIYARVLFTDKMLRLGKQGRSAFMNVLESTLEDAVTDAADSFGRQTFGDGSGMLAKCNAGAATNDIELAPIDEFHEATQYLAEGMFIDIMDGNNDVKVECREITYVDKTTGTIGISGNPVTVEDTYYIVASGNYNQELTGMGCVFATTGELYGIDRDTNKFIIPNIDPVNNEIDEVTIQKAIDDAKTRGGGKINFLLCSDGVKRAYQYYHVTLKTNVKTLELKGGYTALDYNGIPLVGDKYCPKKTLFGLVKEDWKIHRISDWDWMDDDGKILSRVADRPAYEATLTMYADLGCRRPAGQVMLTGITEH